MDSDKLETKGPRFARPLLLFLVGKNVKFLLTPEKNSKIYKSVRLNLTKVTIFFEWIDTAMIRKLYCSRL